MKEFDVAIIGGGPAGLSAAINAASEGLTVGIFDASTKFGGQSSESSLIENYLGFPNGISGPELASLAVTQAKKFGVEFIAPVYIAEIERCDKGWFLCSDIDDEYLAKIVVVATGVSYKRHTAIDLDTFLGRGVSYGAPSLANNYANRNVAVIGGANSAGQAAMHLSACKECNVKIIVRGNGLEDKMSHYLVERLHGKENVEIVTHCNVLAAHGDENGIKHLGISVDHDSDGFESAETLGQMDVDNVFVMIGAKPKTRWLKEVVNLDEHKYILTGTDIVEMDIRNQFKNRVPFPNEAAPGLFVAGDVRYGSVKRVAAAIGEGSATVSQVHRCLSL